MRFQAFVTTWNSKTCNPSETVLRLAEVCPTMLLVEQYDQPFAVQWQAAIRRFHADAFVWVMGDVTPPDPFEMLNLAESAMRLHNVAMWAPNVEWSSQIYNRDKLNQVYPGAYEVCGTDLLCCVVHRNLLLGAPSIAGNSRAWFYDYVLSATAKFMGKRVVRDYNLTALHPRGSIYNMQQAFDDASTWMGKLPQAYYDEANHLIQEQARLCS